MKIYHNPRCSKSRQVLSLVKEKTSNFKIIEYIKQPLTFKEIQNLLKKLNMNPIEIIRKNEKIWKDNYQNKTMNNNDLINAMKNYPKLIERPIVEGKKTAVIGRPPENILSLFDQEGI